MKTIFIPHLYYNFPWKDEHECTPSVHDQTSKGNYNKDADIKEQFKIVLIFIYSITLTFKIKNI